MHCFSFWLIQCVDVVGILLCLCCCSLATYMYMYIDHYARGCTACLYIVHVALVRVHTGFKCSSVDVIARPSQFSICAMYDIPSPALRNWPALMMHDVWLHSLQP